MEFTYSETLTKKLELEFPCFVANGSDVGYYYKLLNKETVLIVTNFSFNKSISLTISDHHNPFSNEGWRFITEGEFNQVHKEVSDELLKELKN